MRLCIALFAAFAPSLGAPATLAQTTPLPGGGSETAPPEVKPLITLEQVSPALSFGYQSPHAFVSETVRLLNTGKDPIGLKRVIGECSCTEATILNQAQSVAPGEWIDILVALDAPGTIGLYDKRILLYTDKDEAPFAIGFFVEVGYPVKVNGGARYSVITKRTGTSSLEAVDGRPFHVISINGAPPALEGTEPASLARTSYRIQHDWTEPPGGEMPRWLLIETDHPQATMIPVQALISGYKAINDKKGFEPVEGVLVLGTIEPEKTAHASMHFGGKAVIPGRQLTVTNTGLDLEARIVNVRKPDRLGGIVIEFEFVPRGGFRGFVSSVVTVEYESETASFDLFARVGPPPAPK